MNRALISGMTLAGLACLTPTFLGAQEYIAGAPFNCTITRPRPVVTTQMHPQQITTFCDVTETRMTQQRVVENVPVTTCKTVTADEGGYQMVWVPKPVTRQVAETTIQQQVKTVSVPVQVVRRVPQVSTQLIPVESVQYVNETVPLQMTAMASTCETCGHRRGHRSTVSAPQIGYIPAPYAPSPMSTAMIPTMPAIMIPPVAVAPTSIPAYQPALAPIPRQQADGSQWQTPNPRSASTAYETVPAREVPRPKDEQIVQPRKTSKFNGVPSAATVWQAQGATSR